MDKPQYYPDEDNVKINLELNRDQFLFIHYMFDAFIKYCTFDMGVLDTLAMVRQQLMAGREHGTQDSLDDLATKMNKERPEISCWCCGETCDEKGLDTYYKHNPNLN